jgi:phosphoglycolate phosphatase-like HAD superfamily hydrolase
MDNQRTVVGLDLDGTLVTCREKQVYALRQAVQKAGIEYQAFDDFWTLKRNGSTTIDALRETGVDKIASEMLAKGWVENVESWECMQQDRLFPGVLESLSGLSQRTDFLLLSARRNAQMFKRQVSELGLDAFAKYREVVYANSDVASAKAVYLRQYGAECYIGDTEADVAAASQANVPIYLVSTGQRSAAFLHTVVRGSENIKVFDTFEFALNEATRNLRISH